METLHIPPNDQKRKSWKNYSSVLYSFGISTKDEELDVPSLY
jgi:hypothetical protein